MSETKFLTQIIESNEKSEFDKLVKTYLKEVLNYKNIIFTDGKDDIGLDVKILELNKQNIQIQLTTQKSESYSEQKKFESKLFKDVEKAKTNYELGYCTNNLYFFYSYKLTNKVIRNYELKALNDYGIALRIIDANVIAESCADFPILQNVIVEISGFIKPKIDSIFGKSRQNMIYELISFGKSAEIKLQIVEIFILQLLYSDKELSKEQIVERCKEKFSSKENKEFYDKLLNRLCSDKSIIYLKESKTYELNTNKRNKIKLLLDKSKEDENLFIAEIYSVLKKYNQENHIADYIEYLKNIYVKNLDLNIKYENINSQNEIYNTSQDFIRFIERKSLLLNSKKIAIELFKVCDTNKYLQKVCATKAFSERTNLNQLDNYVNTKKRIFIDTNIVLHLLCNFYLATDYDNYFYKTASSFYNFCLKNHNSLYLPERYLWEMGSHVTDAINLIPFTTLPSFCSLGKSKNVLYNYYLYLHNKKLELGNYEKFLDKFGFKEGIHNNTINQLLEKYLNDMSIEIIQFDNTYNIDRTKDLISRQLMNDCKSKSNFGLSNDAIMFEYLSDKKIDVHPLEPLFVTWDKTFFNVSQQYFDNNPMAQRWQLVTPSKFIDHYAILNCSIDSEMLTKDIIALLSDEIIDNTHSLIDSIVCIINPKEEVGLQYTERLSKIRDKEIYQAKSDGLFNIETENTVIDNIIFEVTSFFRHEDKLNNLKTLFSTIEYIDDFEHIIIKSIDSYNTTKKIDKDTLISGINKLTELAVQKEIEKINSNV